MLVVQLRQGEAVRIGDVVVRLTKIRTHCVKIGIEASKDTLILREELLKEDDDGKTNVPAEGSPERGRERFAEGVLHGRASRNDKHGRKEAEAVRGGDSQCGC